LDVWISHCRRETLCSSCHTPILLGEPCVFGKYWIKYDSSAGLSIRPYTKRYHWHIKRSNDGGCCWIDQGLAVLPPFVETRGRHPLLLSEDKKKTRLFLLQRHARLVQLLREEMEKLATGETSLSRTISLSEKLSALLPLIEEAGGVPPTWKSSGSEASADTPPLEATSYSPTTSTSMMGASGSASTVEE
jgi:hypothetical protein